MSYFQELCKVCINWLRPGHVCLKSKLGLDEHSERNAIAKWEDGCGLVWQPLNRETALRAMLSASGRFLLSGGCQLENPLVEVRRGVTIFEFEPVDTVEGRLTGSMAEEGAGAVFSAHLAELTRVAERLDQAGLVLERGCWGKSACFHTLWTMQDFLNTNGSSCPVQFGGFVDLTRVPLSLFADMPPLPRPSVSPFQTRLMPREGNQAVSEDGSR